jgi:hypothetical protein
MRNYRNLKVAAWIMAIAIGFCAIIPTAMAGEVVKFEMVDEDFSINESAAYSITYTNGSITTTDPKELTPGEEYTMLVRVSEKNDVKLITDGYMVLELPLEISNVVSKSGNNENDTVGWGYSPKYNTIDFHWVGDKQDSFTAEFTVSIGEIYPLYNIAKINGKFYRLNKTEISSTKAPNTLPAGKVDENIYKTKEYDFTGLNITLEGVTYVYRDENSQEDFSQKSYYTVKQIDDKNIVGVTVVYNKIGGGAGYLVSETYPDPNNTTGFHRDFQITLYDVAYEQDLYNMLKVGSSNNYYRLKKTRIIARNPQNLKTGNVVIQPNDYTLVPDTGYDFTNVVLKIDGENYLYSDHELTGDFTSYFTVKFENVVKQDRTNGDVEWFANEAGWQDGSYAQYGGEPNDVVSYHRNYIATLHKGKPVILETNDNNETYEGLKIAIVSDVEEGTKVYSGTEITLYAQLTGFENKNYTLQWQYTTDQDQRDGNWINVENANGESYSYIIDSTNAHYIWRVVANDITDKQE